MKRVLLVLALLVAFVPGSFGMGKDASQEPQIIPYFIGLGFAVKGNGEVGVKDGEEQLPFVPCELDIQMILPPKNEQKSNSRTTTAPPPSGKSQQQEKTFRGIFKYGDRTIPLKIIQPELTRFEADLVKISAAGADQAPNSVPVGHMTFKMMQSSRSFDVAVGKLMIQTEELDQNSEMTLLMHDITNLHVKATKDTSEKAGPDKDKSSEKH